MFAERILTGRALIRLTGTVWQALFETTFSNFFRLFEFSVFFFFKSLLSAPNAPKTKTMTAA
jgi:hypothetical protein